MQIQHIPLGFDGEEQELIGTEVLFMDHETRGRQTLEAAIKDFNILHEPEEFPERIILIGRYPVKAVHEIMARKTRPRTSPISFGPLVEAYLKKHSRSSFGTEVVEVSEKYL